MIFHKDGSQPTNPDAIFVFGSNLRGVHGAGAAAAARKNYGALYGIGSGLVRKSYAIPTKDYEIKSMPLEKIKPYVESFVEFTKNNPDMFFFVTRVGCGLAGNKDEDMAPMFSGCGDNCSFAENWKEYI
jgi:hypothetical protein